MRPSCVVQRSTFTGGVLDRDAGLPLPGSVSTTSILIPVPGSVTAGYYVLRSYSVDGSIEGSQPPV